MRHWPKVLFLALSAVLIVVVSYCGGGGGGGDGDGDGDASETAITATGTVVFDDGTPVSGATVTANLVTEAASASLRLAKLTTYKNLSRKGAALQFVSPKALVLQKYKSATGQSGTDGSFSIEVGSAELPIDVVVEVSYSAASLPTVDSAKQLAASSATVAFGTITIPNPAGNEVTVSNGSATSSNGALVLSDLPAEVSQLYARTYDPDDDTAAFPGEFTELSSSSLNSTAFLWMEALDSSGNAVDSLSAAATIRMKIPTSQWADLEDITSGTDRIEIPIYTYDEAADMWENEATGWVEDGDGTVLPEDAQSVILDGTFSGDLFATFTTNHLSWMNVDYAYIGPWTLSRLDREKRNVDCLYDAMQLARTIALSAQGRACYESYNVAGADLDVELADRMGPEIKNTDLNNAYGEFKGNEQGDRDDQLYFDDNLWDNCDGGPEDTTFIMAVTLLHETAHWKWDVKHEGGNWKNAEPGGEAGNDLEKCLFGGIITNGTGIKSDGAAVTDEQRDDWLDPDSWPADDADGAGLVLEPKRQSNADALDIEIAVSKTTFSFGEEIPVTVTYTNTGGSSIQVMNTTQLEGYPLWFEIIKSGETERVPFRGARQKRAIDFTNDFTTLAAGATLEKSFNLLRDATAATQLYVFPASGSYSVTACYSGLFGLDETCSDALSVTITPGGTASGSVSNAATGAIISGATIKVLQDEETIATATSGSDGSYTTAELPTGTYTLQAQASGFLKATDEGVDVTAGSSTTHNFSLSPLLVAGQIRLVLTWGTTISDLDSHLWLPTEKQYHVYYNRRGDDEICPFAELDVDDTSFEGPETITISDLQEGSYTYAIYRFSSGDFTTSSAQVQVFDSTGLLETFTVPTTGSGAWWNVLTINGSTGAITEVNTLSDTDAAPYADSTLGCAAD